MEKRDTKKDGGVRMSAVKGMNKKNSRKNLDALGVKSKSLSKNKGSNFIVSSYYDSFELLKKLKSSIFIVLLVLIGSSIFGFFFPGLFEEEILDLIRNILLELEGKSTIELITYISINNIRVSFFAMVFGVLFGIFPIITTIFNGYVIGFSSNFAVSEAGFLVLWRLIPHGIFEIPAIVLSIGMGLYLGSRLLEIKFGIKEQKKRFVIILVSSLLTIPMGYFYYKLSVRSIELYSLSLESLGAESLSLILLTALINMLVIILMIVLFLVFMMNKELKKDLSDSLKLFFLIVVPLLLIAGIIEGLLIGTIA